MNLLDYALGDRAGTYLLASCVLVTALAIISAIIDIPLHTLREAGYARDTRSLRLLPGALLHTLGAVAVATAFLGAASQAYVATSRTLVLGDSLGLWTVTNVAFLLGVAIWGLSAPLTRHWGLSLGAFGLGLAALFMLLAAILQLPFGPTGDLPTDTARAVFAAVTGGILVAIGACLAAILALLTRITGTAIILASEHRRHTDWLTSDWNLSRRPRRLPSRHRVSRPAAPPDDASTETVSGVQVREEGAE